MQELTAADSDGVAALLAEDCVVLDRREISNGTFQDGASLVDVLANLGTSDFHIRLIAVRGDNLALVRLLFDRPEGGVSDTLVVARSGADGRLNEVAAFDVGSTVAAVQHLALLYLSQLDDDVSSVVATSSMFLSSILSGDLDHLRRVLAPDFRHVDFRDGHVLQLDGSQSLDLIRAVRQTDENIIDIAAERHALTPSGVVVGRTQATPETLGLTDIDLVVVGVRGSLVTLLEFHDGDQLATAMARLDELSRR